MKKPLDKFSKQSSLYKKFRPSYPENLYRFIFNHCENIEQAWDCATGNGQVAVALANTFKKVMATDISQKQLGNAQQKDNITYLQSRAENTSFEDSFFDLITVGQALHWFDLEKFYQEAKRVLKPSGVLAVWGYGLLNISTEIDKIINQFYFETIVDYWDFDRKLVENKYETIPFPWKEIQINETFNEEVWWTLDHFYGYFSSWSAVQTYKEKNGINPVDKMVSDISPFWKSEKMKISFPIFMRLGLNS